MRRDSLVGPGVTDVLIPGPHRLGGGVLSNGLQTTFSLSLCMWMSRRFIVSPRRKNNFW